MSVVSSWTLKVKSLEQRTHSVTISSDASVQQLKEAIQSVFDIASHRQRLIFQGKVLKDGTQLAEYANLNDGKIIHLVARPIDAPINTANDDPTTNNSRATRSQLLNGLFSPSDGYTIVTVDANISGISDSNSIINSLINGLVSSGRGRGNVRTRRSVFSMDRNAINDMDANDNQSDNNRNNRSTNNNVLPNILDIPRHPFEAIPGRRLNSDIPSSLIDRNVISAEDRLTRTLIAISNAMTALQTPPSEADLEHPTWTSMANTTPEQNQAFRSSLRVHGTNERAQIGMVLHELTNAMETMSPRLRELAQSLQAQQQPASSDVINLKITPYEYNYTNFQHDISLPWRNHYIRKSNTSFKGK
ncbi:hypothetical protein BJ944DRAFT_121337 [Cunninghamella echinulata]|nr:hypothetical protein BJ944DRAFT_121337 [Cunninghamella echinulata]